MSCSQTCDIRMSVLVHYLQPMAEYPADYVKESYTWDPLQWETNGKFPPDYLPSYPATKTVKMSTVRQPWLPRSTVSLVIWWTQRQPGTTDSSQSGSQCTKGQQPPKVDREGWKVKPNSPSYTNTQPMVVGITLCAVPQWGKGIRTKISQMARKTDLRQYFKS